MQQPPAAERNRNHSPHTPTASWRAGLHRRADPRAPGTPGPDPKLLCADAARTKKKNNRDEEAGNGVLVKVPEEKQHTEEVFIQCACPTKHLYLTWVFIFFPRESVAGMAPAAAVGAVGPAPRANKTAVSLKLCPQQSWYSNPPCPSLGTAI